MKWPFVYLVHFFLVDVYLFLKDFQNTSYIKEFVLDNNAIFITNVADSPSLILAF